MIRLSQVGGICLRLAAFWLLPAFATPSLGDSIYAPSQPTTPSLSMLEAEAELMGLDPAMFYSTGQDSIFVNPTNTLLLGNLALLIESLGGDPTQIALLFQSGAALGGSSPAVQSSGVSPQVLTSTSSMTDVPEPDTMGVLGGTLFLLAGFAVHQCRRIRLASQTDDPSTGTVPSPESAVFGSHFQC